MESERNKKINRYPVTPASNSVQTEFTNVKESDRGRERKRNEQNWEQKQKKRSRDSGLRYSPYKSYNKLKRKQLSSRSLREPCKGCRQDCSSRITEYERKKLFDSYWGLQDSEKQKQFTANSIQCAEPKRHRPRDESETKRRTQSMNYFLGDIKVCQTMFLNTFDVSRKVARTAVSKRAEGNIVDADKRDKMASNVKYNADLIETVKTHIKSFPVMENHYNRESSKRQYLASNLNIRKMYKLFVAENGKTVEEHFYRKIFNKHFNLGFHQPKKDQCDACIEYKNAIDQTKLENEYQEHLKNQHATRNLKTRVKELASKDKSLTVAAFDQQKVLSVPFREHSDFFYKRKCTVYDLTVTNLETRKVYCYIWDQKRIKQNSKLFETIHK